MNILLLSQFFSNTRGGGEYVFSMIAKNLANNGHKVWVITNKINNERYDSEDNIELIFVKPDLEHKGGLPPSFFDNIRYSLNSIRIGLKLIRREKIDIIHSNNFSPALVGSVLSCLTSKPHVTSIWDIFSLCGNDYWDRWTKQAGVSKIYTFLGPLFEKIILKLPHMAIHTVSDASKDDLIKFGATKPIHMIPPSIELSHNESVHSNFLQFVYIGRLVFYKNLEVILRAMKIVKEIEPRVRLVIVGGGPHKKILEEITKTLGLEQNVEFLGYVKTDEKIRILAASSALVFPSLCEGFGLVILEAFEQSKPVLVSNIRPLSDIITHEDNGFILDPHDETQWANHLLRLVKNPEEGIMMGKKGNETLIKKYDISQMYNKIIEMYNSILR